MNYYDEIKHELLDNMINRKIKNYSINKSDLDTYYKVGKILSDAGKHYGEGIINVYSKRLTSELGRKYNNSSLKRMRQFYWLIQKGATVSHYLSFGHYVELLPCEDINKVKYYIRITQEQNLSIRQLRSKIKSNEYERLPEKTKNKLNKKNEFSVIDFVKDPIAIRNPYNVNIQKEKLLHKLILEDIESFMGELGNGFTFVGSEYKIKIGSGYNYIDLLLFNYEYNCFVVIELKITELKKEYIGQVQVYMNYIDENVKTIYQNKTIGIIICRVNNEYLIRYCSDERIISREYELV